MLFRMALGALLDEDDTTDTSPPTVKQLTVADLEVQGTLLHTRHQIYIGSHFLILEWERM